MPAKKPIRQKADKRRRAKVTVGHSADGSPIIKYASGRTQAEIDANIAEVRKAYTGDGQRIEREALFGAYLQSWYKSTKEPTLAPGSIGAYRSAINKHLLPAFGSRQLRAITVYDLQDFLAAHAGDSKSGLGYLRSILRDVFGLAMATGVIDRDPTTQLVIAPKDKVSGRELTGAEIVASLKVADSHPDGLLISVLFFTGVRIGEALGLQWDDIDFARRVIHIRRDIDYKVNAPGALKTKAAYRDIPLADELHARLWPIRGIGSAYVIQSARGSFLPQSTLKRAWVGLMAAIYEADPSIESKPYEIAERQGRQKGKTIVGAAILSKYYRHNYASILYDAGVDVLTAQRFLGHADVKTTLGIYSHLSKTREARQADNVRAALSKIAAAGIAG